MVEGNSIKRLTAKILLKAGPIFLIYASNTISFNIKRIWISRLGSNALEAHIIARTIAELLTLPVPLLISQTPIRVAELFGAIKKKKNLSASPADDSALVIDNALLNMSENKLQQQIGDVVRQGYIISIAASIPMILILMATRKPWISTFGSTENTISEQAADYLLVYCSVVPFDYINTLTEGILSSVDQEKWIIPLRILSSAVDLGLAAWLISDYSLKGDAYATFARNLLVTCATIFLLKFYSPLSKYNILSMRWGAFQDMRVILAKSWPYSLYQLAQSGMSYSLSIFMGHLGKKRLIAYQVPNELFNMVISINTSISMAANRFIAQDFGANNLRAIQRIANTAIISNALIYSINALCINLLQHQLASLFLNQEDLLNYADMLRYNFMILAVVNLFQMLFDNGSQLLSATNDTIFSGLLWLASSAILTLPLSAMSTYLTNFDIYGIESAIGIGAISSALLTMLYWSKRSTAILETGNNVSSSNKILANCISKVGLFCCKNKSSLKNSEVEVSPTQTGLLVTTIEDEKVDYNSTVDSKPLV